MDSTRKLLRPLAKEAYQLLDDETRRKMIFLLRDSELTVKEIASALGLTAQNIYHHVKKLQDGGLIQVSEERRSGHLIESYYTATADTFFYTEDEMEESSVQSSIDVLNGLNEMGIPVEVREESAHELSELAERRRRLMNVPHFPYDICSSCSFSGYFMKFGPMNPVLLNRILQYSSIVRMTDKEFEEYLEQTRSMRRFLLSITRK